LITSTRLCSLERELASKSHYKYYKTSATHDNI
jgi:hypothetical protein